jgi:hypothetical protein
MADQHCIVTTNWTLYRTTAHRSACGQPACGAVADEHAMLERWEVEHSATPLCRAPQCFGPAWWVWQAAVPWTPAAALDA